MTDLSTAPAFEVDPDRAAELAGAGVPVFDVRPESERLLGTVAGALALDADQSAAGLRAQDIETDQQVLLCCATGVRSRQAVESLRQTGFSQATSIAGGFRAWRQAGLPCRYPEGFDCTSADRYARHLVLPGVGPQGQAFLRESRVMLVGAGGLGSPAGLYLAAAGVGRLGVVDDDRVERSNLQRQILHVDVGVGEHKTSSARERITALNPDVQVDAFNDRLDGDNAEALVGGWDVVIDGSDNHATKYATNDACVRLGIPLVYGAVSGFEGQVSVFHPAARPGRNPCYRCLFPAPPGGGQLADCNTAGVLGVVPGMIGVMQASETIKLLLGLGESLAGRMLLVDTLGMQFRSITTAANPECVVCAHPA